MTRVFVYEYLCSGAAAIEPSLWTLADEGRAMLTALAADVAALPGCEVRCLWHRGLTPPPAIPGVSPDYVDGPEHEADAFLQLAEWSDQTILIAPETEGILESRRRQLEELRTDVPVSSANAVQVCADKLMCSRVLSDFGIPTIATEMLSAAGTVGLETCSVVKPRYGAGASETFLVCSREEIEGLYRSGRLTSAHGYVLQPYEPGVPVSVAAIIGFSGAPQQIWPLCRQLIGSRGNQLHYEGGHLPIHEARSDRIATIVQEICQVIPGLHGYVGFDFILPEEGQPLVVDINPRLTTSYLGYRQLASRNPAGCIVAPDVSNYRIEWSDVETHFRPDATPAPLELTADGFPEDTAWR